MYCGHCRWNFSIGFEMSKDVSENKIPRMSRVYSSNTAVSIFTFEGDVNSSVVCSRNNSVCLC